MSSDGEQRSRELPTLSSGLLDRVQQMDPDGWSRLVDVFGPIVYRWTRLAGVSESDAADVVQEVFTSVARGISQFERRRSSGSFRAWLATITRSRVRDHFRRSQKVPVARGGTTALGTWNEIPDVPEIEPDPVDFSGQVARRVMQLLQTEFEERTWKAFLMSVVEGRPPADVAEELEISVASVYQAKSRVLRRIRVRLSEIPQ